MWRALAWQALAVVAVVVVAVVVVAVVVVVTPHPLSRAGRAAETAGGG